jgi:hypothetical protein
MRPPGRSSSSAIRRCCAPLGQLPTIRRSSASEGQSAFRTPFRAGKCHFRNRAASGVRRATFRPPTRLRVLPVDRSGSWRVPEFVQERFGWSGDRDGR